MPAPSFSVVAALSLEEQRGLLERGDGPERLWAAWAIAQRLGRESLPLLRSASGSDLPDGLRRQLLVVLAGMGERDLLLTIAESEPSAAVQATASMLFLRTAPDRRSADTLSFALRQLRSGPIEVRRTVLDEQVLGHLSIPMRDLFPTLNDVDAALRVACAACILKDRSNELYVQGVSEVVATFASESESEVRRGLFATLPRAAVPEVVNAVRSDAARVLEVLGLARAQWGELRWGDVSHIASSATLVVTRAILAASMKLDASKERSGCAASSKPQHGPRTTSWWK